MEDNIKEKLLCDLYTLRVGIAAVAILSEQIKQKKEMNNIEVTYPPNNKSELSNHTSNNCTPKKYYINGNLNNNNIYDECLYNNIKNNLEKRKKARKTKKDFALYIFDLVLSSMLFITCIAITAVFAMRLPIISWVVVCSSIGVILFFCAICYFSDTLFKACKNKKIDDAFIEKHQKFVDEYPEFCAYFIKQIEEYKKSISKLSEDKIKILNALKNEYNVIIDYKYWQYLDLVIYYIQLKNANNLNEILKLIDNQINMCNIENEVCNIAQEINKIIEFDEEELTKKIDNNLLKLTNKIGSLNTEINFSNALQESAKQTSMQLLNSIETID